MTDLNDTERRIAKMLEVAESHYHSDCISAIKSKDQTKARTCLGGKVALGAILNAIRTGQHKDERYD